MQLLHFPTRWTGPCAGPRRNQDATAAAFPTRFAAAKAAEPPPLWFAAASPAFPTRLAAPLLLFASTGPGPASIAGTGAGPHRNQDATAAAFPTRFAAPPLWFASSRTRPGPPSKAGLALARVETRTRLLPLRPLFRPALSSTPLPTPGPAGPSGSLHPSGFPLVRFFRDWPWPCVESSS